MADAIPKPSPLCHWSIHYKDSIEYERCFSPPPPLNLNPDPFNEDSWQSWPESWKEPPFQKRLLDGLASNDFSNVETKSLPIAVPQIIKVSEASDDKFLEEAFGFGIMARNLELVENLIEKLLSKVKIPAFWRPNLENFAALFRGFGTAGRNRIRSNSLPPYHLS